MMFSRTPQDKTVREIITDAFVKLHSKPPVYMRPIEIASLMEDAILAQEDGMMTAEELSATLSNYSSLLASVLLPAMLAAV